MFEFFLKISLASIFDISLQVETIKFIIISVHAGVSVALHHKEHISQKVQSHMLETIFKATLIFLALFGLSLYFWVIVRSHYKHIKASAKNTTLTSRSRFGDSAQTQSEMLRLSTNHCK